KAIVEDLWVALWYKRCFQERPFFAGPSLAYHNTAAIKKNSTGGLDSNGAVISTGSLKRTSGFGLSVLNYTVKSHHISLLVKDRGSVVIAEACSLSLDERRRNTIDEPENIGHGFIPIHVAAHTRHDPGAPPAFAHPDHQRAHRMIRRHAQTPFVVSGNELS